MSQDYCGRLRTYMKALHAAIAAKHSALITNNKNGSRFLFRTVARLTQSQSSVEQHIPISLTSYDFINFILKQLLYLLER